MIRTISNVSIFKKFKLKKKKKKRKKEAINEEFVHINI